MAYNTSLIIADTKLVLKVGDFIPPIKNTVFNKIYLDTHFRPMRIPAQYMKHFEDEFLIKDLTCDNDTLQEYGRSYPVYVCNCYGSNFNGMPIITV